MQEILLKAGCFIAIIILGIILRRVGFFKEGDFRVLSQISLKIVLPATIIVSFSQSMVDISMLTISLIAFCCGVAYLIIAFLINLRTNRTQRAFEILNLPGYNIGLFAVPFVSSFLGPSAVVIASLFDTGNAFVCLGGSFGVASSVADGSGFSGKRVLKALATSAPFITYIVVISINLLGFRLPNVVITLADTVRGANTFLAMLMLGVGFKLNVDKTQFFGIIKVVLIRYTMATIFACIFYFVLPFELEIRQTLVLLAFSPISASVPAFTAEMKGDFGLSSAINSICILSSIIFMTVLMLVML
jgi:predicted permease